MTDRPIFGIKYHQVTTIHEILQHASHQKAEFIVAPLFHPRLRRNASTNRIRKGPKTRSDRELSCKTWTANVVGEISHWIDLNNARSASIRSSSEFAFREEIALAAHLSLQAVLCPYPQSNLMGNYARVLTQTLSFSPYMQYWIHIPIVKPLLAHTRSESSSSSHARDGWHCWNELRTQIGHSHRVGVILDITEDVELLLTQGGVDTASIGSHQLDMRLIQRWTAEPIKGLMLHTSSFLTNAKGYPVLSKLMQSVLSIFLRFKMHIIFCGLPKHSSTEGEPTYNLYTQYIQFLQSRVRESMSPGEIAVAPYLDTLQSPLQPLMDNLEAQTYETFEKDSIKYVQYEAAVELALRDIVASRSSICPSLPMSPPPPGLTVDTDELCGVETPATFNDPIVITVVGAGRGPLVAAALSAATTTGVLVRVYAVEKNENAIITLRNRVVTERWTNVTIVDCDMRSWQPPELADIMVSELLGSWGDNELSPECLDGAQKCLKPDGGISIPANYTSFVLPMSSAKLWMGARDIGDTPQPIGTYARDHRSLDSPYVVKFHNWYPLAATSKPLFVFEHPHRSPFIDNTRFANVSMVAEVDATLHGFCGTFESILYRSVMLSTKPETHTPEMYSWFPLFIPLGSPVTVKKREIISLSVWRCVNSQKIWYEWALTSPIISPIQNSGGKSYWIGL